MVLADAKADPFVVAADLVRQAEHGCNFPVWLVTDNQALAEDVVAIVPKLINELPELNHTNAFAAWRDYAEVILCENREHMAAHQMSAHQNISLSRQKIGIGGLIDPAAMVRFS